jgi:type II secretory pathway predicted ATPase ExeA
MNAKGIDKSTILEELKTEFLAWKKAGRRALLIVDEAQDLKARAMEELRLLTNLQLGGTPLLQIFLLGQPELRDLVHDKAFEPVHQRIIAANNEAQATVGEINQPAGISLGHILNPVVEDKSPPSCRMPAPLPCLRPGLIH